MVWCIMFYCYGYHRELHELTTLARHDALPISTSAIRVSSPFAMPMRPLVGRGYAPDTRAVSESVAPMVNTCDPRTKVRSKTRRGRSPDLRDLSPILAPDARPPARQSEHRPKQPPPQLNRCSHRQHARSATPR